MRIQADRERCVGAGMCVLTAPGSFDQDDSDGRVVLRSTEPDAAARAAAESCPSGALTVVEG